MVAADLRIVRTVRDLSRDPGTVVRDYLRGRRVPYVHPFKYAFFTATFAFLVQRWLVELQRSNVRVSAAQERAQDFLVEYGQLLNFLVIPLFAGMLRAAFPRKGLRWIEHLVLVLYGFGHLFLVQTLFTPLLRVGGVVTLATSIATALLPMAYLSWIGVATWGGRWWTTTLRIVVLWTTLQAGLGWLMMSVILDAG